MGKVMRLDWIPDLPDHRDYRYENHPETVGVATLPISKDLTSLQSPVINQGDLSDCTGAGISSFLEYFELEELKQKKPPAQAPEVFDPGKFDPISRLFIWTNERLIEGTPLTQNSGVMIRSGIKAIQKYGFCKQSTWQDVDANAYKSPTEAAYKEASIHHGPLGYRVNNQSLVSMKMCIANSFPFLVGVTVFQSFMSPQVMSTGIVPYPSLTESMMGGHCFLIVGYDDYKQVFIGKNSWGVEFGNKGYLTIPYSYILNPDLCSDCWTLRLSAKDFVFQKKMAA